MNLVYNIEFLVNLTNKISLSIHFAKNDLWLQNVDVECENVKENSVHTK